MKRKLKNLLFYGILLALFPFSALALTGSINELQQLFSSGEQNLSATILYPNSGGTGTSTNPTFGQVLMGNAGGTYDVVATSTLGIIGGGGGTGTVTSVDLSVPTGFTIADNPITTAGTLALGIDTGYQMLTDVASSTWDAKDEVTTAGDGLTRTANDFDCDTANTSTFGCLTNTDWDTFNNKLSSVALTDLTLAENSVYRGNASNNPEATSDLTILSNGKVGIGTDSPTYNLDVYEDTATSTLKISSGVNDIGGSIIIEDDDGLGFSESYTSDGLMYIQPVEGSGQTISGYIFSDSLGWISLSCENNNSCDTVEYSVKISGDNVFGYAWGESAGFIHFSGNCKEEGECPNNKNGYSAKITFDGSIKKLHGYIWSEKMGWIKLSADDSDYANTSTSTYGVYIDADNKFNGYAWFENGGWIKWSGTDDDGSEYGGTK